MVQRAVSDHHHPNQGLFLCCVCHEQNTAYYGVVFNQSLRSKAEEGPIEEADSGYYNFPLRHPRHGHLQWVLKPELGSTYPDYPVHIRTTTLARFRSLNEKGRMRRLFLLKKPIPRGSRKETFFRSRKKYLCVRKDKEIGNSFGLFLESTAKSPS